jgi:hypothetical protein
MKKLLKRISPFEIALVITILGIHLYAAMSDAYNFPNYWFKRDDAFYYYKVAQNISEGNGSTFDGINPTNGYHPLWMLVNIPIFALARFDLILPLRVLLMVLAGLHSATAILIYRIIKTHLSQAVAIFAAVFWSFHSHIHVVAYTYGLETGIAAFAIVLLIYNLSAFEKEWKKGPVPLRRILSLALLAAMVMFSRLDLVFLAVITGAWIIFRGKFIRHLLPLDIFVIAASMTASVALRTGLEAYNNHYAYTAVEAAILAVVVKIIALYFFGTYQHPRALPLWKMIRQTAIGVTAGTAATALLFLLLLELGLAENFPRSAFFVDWSISLPAILSLRLAAVWFSNPKPNSPEAPWDEFKANWKTWLTDGAAYYGVMGGLLAVYMLFNKVVFGTSSPVSGQVKRWWGSMPVTLYEGPASNWFSFFGIGRNHFNAWQPLTDLFYWAAEFLRPLRPGAGPAAADRYYLAMVIFAVIAMAAFFISRRRTANALTGMALIPLVAGTGIHILSYTVTSYGGAKEWYWVSQMLMITFGVSLLIDTILKPLLRLSIPRITLEIAAVLIGVSVAHNFGRIVTTVMSHGASPPDRAYMEVVQFLEENTPPGSVIGMTGGGNVGYLIEDRTIVNMDGLINSYEYFQALQNGDAAPYLHEHGMTIVFANPFLLTLPPYHGQFELYLEGFGRFGGKSLLYLLGEPKP